MKKLDATTDGQSPNFATENLAVLRKALPQAFTEGRLDVEALKCLVGTQIETEAERYGLTWSGKNVARLVALSPSSGTLLPDAARSSQWGQTQNVFIEGDNLEALKILQKSLHRRVKLIYVAPPYNTGTDRLYPGANSEGLQTYLRYSGQSTPSLTVPTNSQTSGRYHTNWLNMMYPRLMLARNLLTDDGYVAVSVDDSEFKNLEHLMSELYGEENRLATLVIERSRKNDARFFSVGHEYVVIYARDKAHLGASGTTLRMPKEGVEEVKELFRRLRIQHKEDWGEIKKGIDAHFAGIDADDPRAALKRFSKLDERGPFRTDGDPSWPGGGGPRYDVPHPITGRPCKVPSRGWVWPTYERMQEEIRAGNIVFGEDEKKIPSRRRNLFDADDQVMGSVHYSYSQTTTQEFAQLFDGRKVYDNPQDPKLMRMLVDYLTGPDDTVLDLFAGSGTTAHAVLLSNALNNGSRRYICIQLPEPLDDDGESSQAARELCAGLGAPNTVMSIALERVRRAAALLAGPDKQQPGFRVFRLAESNIKAWGGLAKDLERDLLASVDSIREGRSHDDILYELLLKYGLDLTIPVEERAVAGRRVFVIGAGALVACLDTQIDLGLVEGIAGLRTELNPVVMRVVLRDEGFPDDVVKANAFQMLKRAGIEDVRSL